MKNLLVWFVLGIAGAYLIPGKIKGRPALSVFFVWLRRHKATKWLMWTIPLTRNDTWYYDIVERDVYGKTDQK